ncbi:MAG: hypothetical protein US72_C0002G0050 [Microgenomates group bacterium GW2011_GWC1_38_12]|uniref:DUF4015 domain-containing protein n=1 Tax=Candidatus Vogelbacteria bacterium RIFOXYB1_FULL_42_16 TaxID=1802436 RepID=A0A1G2QF61_9BACT|nr:MAG: hypothetical protein US72_C0002G0050 [Microgenomates group bacterium GW2011_GWC1_38_12]KKS78156.1 MAG: hypothetical protein UV50_C0001G0066 [Parcubacteria group bacterium GW2011_GWB1_42_9]OHA59117.1 MAG: hypothetical protein A2370_02950 [Candidatus Vogelbacteria bacterium RIFOXYB1_FULL_42_16]
MSKRRQNLIVVVGVVFLLLAGAWALAAVFGGSVEYDRNGKKVAIKGKAKSSVATVAVATNTEPVVTHLKTPKAVKAIYMTSWIAGSKNLRPRLIDLIDRTELNAVVIDIKDYTGLIAFEIDNPAIKKLGSFEKRITDLPALIAELHRKNIYVIGRISTFQDASLAKKRPDLAVKRASDGAVWRDRKGISWLDAGSKEAWDYTVLLAKESYALGFDELNFDYIRFPSDGNMRDIAYPFSHATESNKPDVLAGFFKYLSSQLHPLGIPISADLFGMVCTNYDDLGIGQVLEKAAPYFDFIAPMVYPSHYPTGYMGIKKPALSPYAVINHNMKVAAERLEKASTTRAKLRPWLQDFDLGADYTAEMIREEKRAVYDNGLNSWMMWDPGNHYTTGAYDSI